MYGREVETFRPESLCMGAAQGILKYYGKEDLAELINRQWAYSVLKRMKFVRRKATTSKSKYTFADFAELKKSFLRSVVETVTMEEISPQLGINIIPSSSWTLEEKGSKRIELVSIKDKHQITAIFCCSIQGDFLPVQLIYKGTTARCHPKHKFPPGWDITHSKKHWSVTGIFVLLKKCSRINIFRKFLSHGIKFFVLGQKFLVLGQIFSENFCPTLIKFVLLHMGKIFQKNFENFYPRTKFFKKFSS